MNILTKIERAHFLASPADIETMAAQRQDGADFSVRAAGTYLKVLVALTAREIGGATAHLSRRRGRAASALRPEEVAEHLAALDRVNAICYGAVAQAVIPPELVKVEGLDQAEQTRRSLERNRRTNYARTALTAVRLYISAGRDVRDLEPAAVTKDGLRSVAEQHRPPPRSVSAGRLVRAATRASERIVAEAEQLAGIDPEQAEKLLDALMNELQGVLDKLRAGELEQRDVGTTTIVTRAVRDAAMRPGARGSPQPGARA